MKKIFKCFILSAMLVWAFISVSKAFFLGSDAYTAEEYKDANIVWTHNTILADEYYFNGTSITQKLAEQLTTLYRNTFKKECCDGTRDANMYNLYTVVAQFTISTAKEMAQEVNGWRNSYYGLSARNTSLELENSRLKNLLRIHSIDY